MIINTQMATLLNSPTRDNGHHGEVAAYWGQGEGDAGVIYKCREEDYTQDSGTHLAPSYD
jgi:hypothetical protein